MTATIIANNRATRDAYVPAPTLHEDGTPVKWRMFYEGGRYIADSDSLADLIEVLIPGYTEKEDVLDSMGERFIYARNIQSALRAEVLAGVTADKWEGLTSDQQQTLSFDSEVEINFETEDGGVVLWDTDVPLVLIDVMYQPYGSLVAPLSSEGDYKDVSNILWLRVATEREFLESLTRAGIITFGKPRAVHRTPAALRERE